MESLYLDPTRLFAVLFVLSGLYILYNFVAFLYEYYILLCGCTLYDGEKICKTEGYRSLLQLSQHSIKNTKNNNKIIYSKTIPAFEYINSTMDNYEIVDFAEKTLFDVNTYYINNIDILLATCSTYQIPYTIFPVNLPLKLTTIDIYPDTTLYRSRKLKLIGTDYDSIVWLIAYYRRCKFIPTLYAITICISSFILYYCVKGYSF